MTIISVAYTSHGIAMASDSRFTRSVVNNDESVSLSTVTDNAEKMFLIRNSTVGISLTGDPHIVNGKHWQDLVRSLDKYNKLDKISKGLQTELINASANIHAYVAGFDSGDIYIYQVSRESIKKVNTYDAGFLAMGNTEGVKKLLHDTSILNSEMALLDLAKLAEFIVKTEIDYEHFFSTYSWCGGPVDVLVISQSYGKFLKHKIIKL